MQSILNNVPLGENKLDHLSEASFYRQVQIRPELTQVEHFSVWHVVSIALPFEILERDQRSSLFWSQSGMKKCESFKNIETPYCEMTIHIAHTDKLDQNVY